MSRPPNFVQREGRIAQMSRQEEVIARKRQELLERQRTNELAKQVVAAQTSTAAAAAVAAAAAAPPNTDTTKPVAEEPPAKSTVFDPLAHLKNSFTNDGSFFENFKRITEAAKKAEEDKLKAEAEKAAKEREIQEQIKRKINESQMAAAAAAAAAAAVCDVPSFYTPDAVFSTNSMMSMKDVPMFPPAMPPILNLAPPPPPPPIVQAPDIAPPPVLLPHDHPVNGDLNPNDTHMSRGHAEPMASSTNALNAPFNVPVRAHDGQLNATAPHANRNSEHGEPTEQRGPCSEQPLNLSNASVPTTIDDLIEFIAVNGDQHEEIIRAHIAQMNERSLFRFLYEKDSDIYRTYRHKVMDVRAARADQSTAREAADKYDPTDILCDDDDDHDGRAIAENAAISGVPIEHQQPVPITKFASIDNSDEYDSDTEYQQQVKERNLENMKRKIDSGAGVKRYAERTDDFESDEDHTDEEDHMEMYRRIQMREDALQNFDDSAQSQKFGDADASARHARNRKKRSRWGEKSDGGDPVIASTSRPPPIVPTQTVPAATVPAVAAPGASTKPMLSAITRSDPGLLNYARLNYGTINLSEEDWHKCEEHYKVNLLYQDMLKKRQEIDRMARTGRYKYEYDSDEDIAGGTWEHKLRNAEMEATAAWANALTRQTSGKHHIGDFLPPEELKKFMEIYKSKQLNREPDLSDYKEFKLKEDNKGFQLLQKLGWTEGQGLGLDGTGIVNPVNKAPQRDTNQGLGLASNTVPEAEDNEYDAYRKRMMLAYRFRPNPLNNPRRAYY